ncbi:hypothetical protein Tco_0408123 [Tanacetum coccineum]
MFIDSQFTWDYDSQMTEKYFVEYIGIEVKQFRETLLQHMGNIKKSVAERTPHKRQYDRRVNKRQMQTHASKVDSSKALDADLVVMKSNGTESEKHDTSNSSGNYLTHVVDADIRPVYDRVASAEVQLIAQHNVLANEQQHTEQSEPIYDTYLLEKVDSNTTPDSTNMSHRGGEIDEDAEQYQVKSSLLNVEFFKTKDMVEKEVYNELSNRFYNLKNIVFHLKFQYNKRKKVFKVTNHVLQPPRNQSVVRQPNAFKSERPNFSKPRFASQVNMNNVLSKPVTPYYLPKVQEYVLAKPHHVIAPGSSRNSQEESYGSNDMAYNHYLEEARKNTQERNRNSKYSVMHTTSLQITTNGSKQKPRSNNQTSRSLSVSKSSGVTSNSMPLVDHSRNSSSFSDSKHFVCSTCQNCVFNANHDDCITKFLKKVNYRAKSFVVHEKPNTPRSCLRGKPTGRIFKTASLRWIPTGKMFTDSITKVDSEPPNGSNDDITNPYECDQTLNVSAGTLNLSAGFLRPLRFRNVPIDVFMLIDVSLFAEGDAKTCEAWERFKGGKCWQKDDTIDKLEVQLSTLVEIVSKIVFFKPKPHRRVLFGNTGFPTRRAEMKAITFRSGVVATSGTRGNEEITDKEQNDFQGSTAQIPPPVIPKPIPEPEIPKTLPKSTPIPEPKIPKTVPKPSIPYPSRRDNQKNLEKASY